MTGLLDDAGAVVTGGTSGLGAAAAVALAAHGAQVVLAGRNATAGEAVLASFATPGRFQATDVTDEDAVERAVAAAAGASRGVRVAVAAAGTAVVAQTVDRSGAPHPVDAFTRMMQTNLVGSFNLLRFAAAAMARNEPDGDGARGVVVLTSSVGGIEGSMGQVAYAAAKGGIIAMVLPAARDLARSGIRVMCIAPGVFDTPFMDVLSEEAKAAVAGAVPFPPRLGRAEEYASLVLEIVRNPMLNGETIRLDGALRLGPR